eukprot:2349302-Rhodomonas_salina.1
MFVRRVKEALKIPILGLFDSDAHGLKILSVYVIPILGLHYPDAHGLKILSVHARVRGDGTRLSKPRDPRHQVARRAALGPRQVPGPERLQ